MRVTLVIIFLAPIIMASVAAQGEDTTCQCPERITWTVKRHPITALHPNDLVDNCHGAIHCHPQCDIYEQCQGDCGISRVNHQFVAACTLCIFILVARAASILFRFLVSREVKPTLDGPQSRGRQNKTIAAPVPTKNRLKPQGSVSTPTCGIFSSEVEVKTSSECDDTLVDPALVVHESQPDEAREVVTDGIAHSEGTTQTAAASGVKRGASGATSQSSPPVTEGARLDFSQTGFYRSFAYLVDRITSTVTRYRFIPRFGSRPLANSLYGYDPILSIFAIAGDDAKRDLAALHSALVGSHRGNVRFASFSRDIPLDSIEAEIEKLYDECRAIPDTHLFVYLTGHGDDDNNMIISQSKTISETQLFELFSASEPIVEVTLLFDICRPAKIHGAIPPSGISLIRACSLGETAGACRVPNCDGPDSCFLNALMMSARTPNLKFTSETLKKAVQGRLDQLMDFLKAVYVMRHSEGRCLRCSNTLRPCDKPERQNVDWGDAKDLNGLLELTKILSSSKIAEEVYQRFMGNEVFCRVNNLPGPGISWPPDRANEVCESSLLATTALSSPTLDFSPLPEDNTVRHERGANGPVHAGRPQEWNEGFDIAVLAGGSSGCNDTT